MEILAGGPMRVLLASVLALVLGSLATNAAPQADTPKVDPSRVKFLLSPSGINGVRMSICTPGVPRNVRGIVAREIDLGQDAVAQQVLRMGVMFAQKQCPSVAPSRYSVRVALRSGDPAAFTEVHRGFEFLGENVGCYGDNCPADFVGAQADISPELSANPIELVNYMNYGGGSPAEKAARKERLAAAERQRDAQTQAQLELAARSAAFVKANGVAHFLTIQQLTANPFVYQGQVVAIYGEFQQMNSATQALFSSDDRPLVVSAIPTAKFTQQRSMVLLAGRVLGNIEMKLALGTTLVPHLSYVGSVFCQQSGCRDYAINLK